MARKMKDSGVEWIGMIPEEWNLVPIQRVADYNTQVLSEDTVDDFKFDYIDIGSVTYGKGIEQFQRMTFKGSPSRARRIVHENDVIVSTVRTYLKACAQVPKHDYPLIASTGFLVLTANKSINSKYLKYAVISDSFVSGVEACSVGISYPAINSLDAVKMKIPLAPIAEQRRIADFLDVKCASIDDVIAKTNESIEEYKKLKQAVITEAVTKGVRGKRPMKDSGSVWFGKIPSEWNMVKFKHIVHIRKDIAGTEGYTVLSITQRGIIPKDLSKNEGQLASDYSNYQLVDVGDFAMNHMDLLTGWVDISKYNGVTSPDYRVFVLNDSKVSYAKYYLYLVQMCYIDRIFYSLGQGVSGFGRWRLPADQFLNFMVAVPSYNEQKEIAEYIERKCAVIDSLIEKKQQFIDELTAYKKSLIYEYVTGKKEVPA